MGFPKWRKVDDHIILLAVEWIKITAMCSRLHVLPSCGGLYDQDPRDLEKMTVVLNCLDKKEKDELDKA